MPKPTRLALRAPFTLGGEQAEADSLLESGFFLSSTFQAMQSPEDPRCFLIGRTGSGKSAALQKLEEMHPEHVVRIAPENLSLPYIADLGVMQFLTSQGVHLDPFFIALWKHVLLVEILRHRYKVDSPSAKQNFLSALRDRINRDSSKRAALDYLDEFGERFWCETDERVRDITSSLQSRVEAEASASAPLGLVDLTGKLAGSIGSSEEVKTQQVERFQNIVNETQLPRLNKMIDVLNEDILDSPQHFTYVIIDDLDRDWVDEKLANDLIRCLFRTVIDLTRIRNLKIIVALRTNIFDHLDFGSRTGGQEEKFRALTLKMAWERKELAELLDRRCHAAGVLFDRPEVHSFNDIFPRPNKARGKPLDFVLDRTLQRPRDCIAFVNECLVKAGSTGRASWEDIRAAEQPYSYRRLLALRDEWKPSFPGIDRLFEMFQGRPHSIDSANLRALLDDAVLILLSDPRFPGSKWLTECAESIWSPSGDADGIAPYQPLIRLLYRIGFIGVNAKGRSDIVYSYTEPEFVERPSNLRDASFEVHPAFWAALDISAPKYR